MSFWEIEASVSPAREIHADGTEQSLVRVQSVDLDNADPAAHAFIDPRSTCARRLALEILAAADDADWQTQQDGCPQEAQSAPHTRHQPPRRFPRARERWPPDWRRCSRPTARS